MKAHVGDELVVKDHFNKPNGRWCYGPSQL
jgi:hypothetical protein